MRLLIGMGVGMVVVAAAILVLFKGFMDDYVTARSLTSVTVTAPDNWVVAPYKPADGLGITQTHVVSSDGPVDTTGRILAQFDAASSDPIAGAAWTFARGDKMVAVAMTFGEHRPRKVGIAEELGLSPKPSTQSPNVLVATVSGVPFFVTPRISKTPDPASAEPVLYRHFIGTIGDQEIGEVVDIAVLTNGSDADVAGALRGINMEEANDRLPNPWPDISMAAGIETPDQMPLSQTPPPPSFGYRAAELLRGNDAFDPPWQEALERIKSGEIDRWSALTEAYPDDIETVPFALLTVLDDGTATNVARYFAQEMLDSGRDWNNHEHYILTKVANPATEKEDLEIYFSQEYDVAPEVMALIGQLPTERPVEAVLPSAGNANSTPAVRTSSPDCRIENGVRRCVVGGN